jgi:multidrug efflux system membrane fusion protein
MRRRTIVFSLLAGAALLIIITTVRFGGQPPRAAAPAARIPVSAAIVKRQDVPIYLSGLGTVLASNSVLLKTRVDGQIVKVNFSEGQDVHAGDVLVEIDPKPFEATLAQAQATQLKDQAQLEQARRDFDRATRLASTGSGTTTQLDTTRTQVAQLEAALKADQAIIDSAQIQLNYSRIRAPVDGRTGTRLVDMGNIVRASDNTGIVTINQIHPIFVDYALPATSLSVMRARFKDGTIEVVAQDRDGNDLATGKLAVIDNQVNPTTSTIRYKATFDNADEVLWPGQYVNVRVQLEVRRDVVTVPVTTVQRGPDGPFAFVVKSNQVVEKRPIKVGLTNSTLAVIDDGLRPGEQVVSEGQYRVQAGSVVDILPTASASTDDPAAPSAR